MSFPITPIPQQKPTLSPPTPFPYSIQALFFLPPHLLPSPSLPTLSGKVSSFCKCLGKAIVLWKHLGRSTCLPRTYTKVPCLSHDLFKVMYWTLPLAYMTGKVSGLQENQGKCRVLQTLQRYPVLPRTFFDVCSLHLILYLGYITGKVPVLQDGLGKGRGLPMTFVKVPCLSGSLAKWIIKRESFLLFPCPSRGSSVLRRIFAKITCHGVLPLRYRATLFHASRSCSFTLRVSEKV